MLSLFKESEAPPVSRPAPIDWARGQWRALLDKGHTPQFNALKEDWLKEYPNDSEGHIEIEAWALDLSEAPWLSPLFQTPGLREIYAHGPELVEAIGAERRAVVFPGSSADWGLWIETLAHKVGAEFNFTRPCSSSYWMHRGERWRVTLLHASLGTSGTAKVFLRRLAPQPYPLDAFGTVPALISVLEGLVRDHRNILVAGPTGSGKTALLSSLLACHDPREHLITLEDVQELTLSAPRCTRLIGDEREGRSLSQLLTYSLRLSPERIVLGEMRSHEVVPFILAMNTGHRGVMGTVHAASASDALHRLAQLFSLSSGRKEMDYSEVLRLVCRNVQAVVFVEERRIQEVIRVFGSEQGQVLYDQIWGLTPIG